MGMRIEHTLALELCKKKRDARLIQEIACDPGFNYEYFLITLNRHLVLPAALNELVRYSFPGPIKGKVGAAAKNVVLGTTLQNNMIKNEFFSIKTVLEKQDVDFVLMKGLSLDFSGIRTIGDLDILVREKDILVADRLVRGTGFEYAGDAMNLLIKEEEKGDISRQLDWNNQFQYVNRKNRLLLELHTNLFERSRAYIFNLDPLLDNIEMFWENRTWNNSLGSYVFSRDDLLILMCLHTALKRSLYSNTFILRNLVDIGALIGPGIDWNVVLSRSRVLNVSSFILFSLSLAVQLLEEEVPGAVMDTLRHDCTRGEKYLVALHLKCYHDLESSWLVYTNLYKILASFVYQEKWLPRIKRLLLLPVLFPPRSKMAEIYHITMTNPLIYCAYLAHPFRLIGLLLKRIAGLFRR
jgi:hypothetical protein